jgi:outer membrane receptor protein involved in Fe transport
MRFKRFVIGAAATIVLSAPAAYCQSADTAALVNSFIGVGETATSTLSNLAAQRQALQMEREQQQSAFERQELQQEQAVAQRHHCPAGESGAVVIHADGSTSLICEQRR